MASADEMFVVASFEQHTKEISDTVIESHPLLWSLQRQPGGIKRNKGGTAITWPVLTEDDPSVASFDWYDPLVLTAHNPVKRASVEFSGYHGGMVLSKWERRLNQYEPSQVLDQYETKRNNLRRTFLKTISQDLYADSTGTKNVDGLAILVSDSVNYAGFTRGTDTFFDANVRAVTTSFATDTDSDGVANGIESMRLLWMDCCHGSGGLRRMANSEPARTNDCPNLILTTQTTWINFEQELLPNQRYQDREMANAGFSNLTFHQVPIVWDRNATADRMWFLNTDYFELQIVGNDLIELDVAREEYSPHAFVLTYIGQFQLVLKNPRYCGVLSNTD